MRGVIWFGIVHDIFRIMLEGPKIVKNIYKNVVKLKEIKYVFGCVSFLVAKCIDANIIFSSIVQNWCKTPKQLCINTLIKSESVLK